MENVTIPAMFILHLKSEAATSTSVIKRTERLIGTSGSESFAPDRHPIQASLVVPARGGTRFAY